MREVYQLLSALESESKSNGKKALIEANINHQELMTVFKYALDQDKHYNLKKLPMTDQVSTEPLFPYLDYLAKKRGTTNEEALELARRANAFEYGPEIVSRIIKKDLRCGVKDKLINSVVPNYIYNVPYQRYSSFAALDKVDFEKEHVLLQLKMNGMFGYHFHSTADFSSRRGNRFYLGDRVRDGIMETSEELGGQVVLTGEILVQNEDRTGYLSRQESNGIINRFISGDGDPAFEDRIKYVIWGFITEAEYKKKISNRNYYDTWEILQSLKSINKDSVVQLVPTFPVRSREEAIEKYMEFRQRKEEGAMVKVTKKLMWRDQTSGNPYGVKLKPFAECEFEIVDAYYGAEGKQWADLLGGLTVKSVDGKIVSNVGTGFSEYERQLGVDWWKEQIGGIVTIRFVELLQDSSDREEWRLGNSSFVETRFNEKTEADTYEHCVKELENV